MSNKMTKCKTCGADVAKNAKTCPACGAKRKKMGCLIPVVVVLAIMLIGMIGGGDDSDTGGGSGSAQVQEPITYTAYTVKQLADDLKNNALKAEKTYQDQYVELTGELGVIDSDGKYIALRPAGELFALSDVQCYMKNETQVEQVMEMSVGDTVVVRGKITEIGELLGYQLDITEFVK